MSTSIHTLPSLLAATTLIGLTSHIRAHETHELSPIDSEYLADLAKLGDQADAIAQLAKDFQYVMELLQALHGHCHFDISGTESTEEYATLKNSVRLFLEAGKVPATGATIGFTK